MSKTLALESESDRSARVRDEIRVARHGSVEAAVAYEQRVARLRAMASHLR